MNSRNTSEEEIPNQKNTKDCLKNIKSNIILKKLFNCMKKNKSLEIIKYNKTLQNRLDLNINDYNEYSQLYSSIEIKLKPLENKYGKFINIPYEEKEYYHIYFDNSNKEIKRNYLKVEEKVNSIKIIIDYQVKSFKELFYNCKCIKAISFKKFYRINVNGMNLMFYRCSSLNELNLSNFNTNNVTDMSVMFFECSSLKELNLSNFNTNNVRNMSGMFFECKKLKKNNIITKDKRILNECKY